MASIFLKGLALAMAVAAFVLGLLGNTDTGTLISLLSVGLIALVLNGFLGRS